MRQRETEKHGKAERETVRQRNMERQRERDSET